METVIVGGITKLALPTMAPAHPLFAIPWQASCKVLKMRNSLSSSSYLNMSPDVVRYINFCFMRTYPGVFKLYLIRYAVSQQEVHSVKTKFQTEFGKRTSP